MNPAKITGHRSLITLFAIGAVVLDGCGHHTRRMLTADPALALLFPKD